MRKAHPFVTFVFILGLAALGCNFMLPTAPNSVQVSYSYTLVSQDEIEFVMVAEFVDPDDDTLTLDVSLDPEALKAAQVVSPVRDMQVEFVADNFETIRVKTDTEGKLIQLLPVIKGKTEITEWDCHEFATWTGGNSSGGTLLCTLKQKPTY